MFHFLRLCRMVPGEGKTDMSKASSRPRSAGNATRQLYRESARKLNQCLDRGGCSDGRVVLGEDSSSEVIPIPLEVLRALADLLGRTAEEHTPAEQDSNGPEEMLTTTQAADFIGVSRPFLVKRMEEGLLPYRRGGSHRRVSQRDLMSYKRSMDRNRARTLEELSALDQELGFGYEG